MSAEARTTKTDIGAKGREVMEAFVRAAAHGFIDDVEDMTVSVDAIQELVGDSKHAVDGAIEHLLSARILKPIVVSGPDGFKEAEGWYYLTPEGAEWLVEEGIVPNELVAAFFPHTAGWSEEDVGHFPNWGDLWQEDLAAWGESKFPEDLRYVLAKAAHEREIDELFG